MCHLDVLWMCMSSTTLSGTFATCFLVCLSLSGTVIPQAILANEFEVNSTQLNVFCNLDFIHLF